MKKILTGVIVLLCCIFSPIFCTAEESYSVTAGEDFAVFGKDKSAAERLNMTEEQLQEICKTNDIVYLAVDQNNSRQIRLSVSDTQFANSIGSLSNLSDEKIRTLLPDLTGETQGEIIVKNGQKFIRQDTVLSDSGGNYLLTRYITVSEKKYYTLSFYTQSGVDVKYTERVFHSFSSPNLEEEQIKEVPRFLKIVLPIFILLFSLGAGGIVFFLIRNIRKQTTKEKSV